MNCLKTLLIRSTSTRSPCAKLSTAEYCMKLVRTYDYENFLTTLLLEKHSRSCAFAIRSFNVEIARVPEQVTQQHTALMRFHFWEDTLDKCFSNNIEKVPQHPVAIELFKAINKHQLSKQHLRNLIVSRKEHKQCFKDLDEQENYLHLSTASTYFLILEGCGVRDINADHAASHLGKAQGLVQQLRFILLQKEMCLTSVLRLATLSLFFCLENDRCYQPDVSTEKMFLMETIPQTILTKHNVSQEDVYRSKASKSLSDCVYEVACSAHQHLKKARSLKDKVPVKSKLAFLPAVPTSLYLERLQAVDYDVFHPKIKHRPWNLLLYLWLYSFRNKY